MSRTPSASNASVPSSLHLLEDIQRLVETAVRLSCGEDYLCVFDNQSARVKINQAWHSSGDFQCSCAVAIYRRALGIQSQRQQQQQQQVAEKGEGQSCTGSRGGDCIAEAVAAQFRKKNDISSSGKRVMGPVICVEVTTTSEYGLVRERAYSTPVDIANAIIDNLPEEERNTLIGDIRVAFIGCGPSSLSKNDTTDTASSSDNKQQQQQQHTTTTGTTTTHTNENTQSTAGGETNTTKGKRKNKDRDGSDKLSANIIITTKEHLKWQLQVNNRVPCYECGQFFAAGRSLRMHQISEHEKEYCEAQSIVRDMEYQMVVYSPALPYSTPLGVGALPPPCCTTTSDPLSCFSAPKLVVSSDCTSASASSLASASSAASSTTSASISCATVKTTEGVKESVDQIELCDGLNACRNGDLKTLQESVLNGTFDAMHTVDRNGCDGLCWAAGNGHLDVCKYLVLECNAPLLLRGKVKRKRHALHWAARNGHILIMDWLVNTPSLGVDVNIGTEDGTTALHYAVWSEHMEAVRWLVECAQCNVHSLNTHGCNASQWAALNGNISILTYLKDEHALDVSILNRNGHSALHKAAMKGQSEMCRWLLTPALATSTTTTTTTTSSSTTTSTSSATSTTIGAGLGVDHMQADRDGYTPSLCALHNGFEDLALWLIKQEENMRIM